MTDPTKLQALSESLQEHAIKIERMMEDSLLGLPGATSSLRAVLSRAIQEATPYTLHLLAEEYTDAVANISGWYAKRAAGEDPDEDEDD